MLEEQLDDCFARAPETRTNFDAFCRQVLGDIGLDHAKVMLEQAEQTWRVHTEVELKSRDRAAERPSTNMTATGVN